MQIKEQEINQNKTMKKINWEQEYVINDEITIKFKKLKPTKFIGMFMNFELNDDKTMKFEKVSGEVWENTEILVNGKWHLLKEGDLYLPVWIEERIDLLIEIVKVFFKEVINPVFLK